MRWFDETNLCALIANNDSVCQNKGIRAFGVLDGSSYDCCEENNNSKMNLK